MYNNIDILNERFRIENVKLGSGSFATVYLGTDIHNNQKVAIKKISLREHLDKLSDNEKIDRLNKMNREIDIMRNLDHPNIVKLIDVIKKMDYWFIIMEYCDKGTLKDVIELNKKILDHTKREANTYYYLEQFRSALYYLTRQGYIHRDIKPTNILLSKSTYDLSSSMDQDKNLLFDEENKKNTNKIILKIADFGLARDINEDENQLLKTTCGSPMYMAPEVLIRSKYNNKADLWSFGIIMYELLFGERPFKVSDTSRNPYEELVNITHAKNIDFHLEYKYTADCNDLLQKLLNKNKEFRINWEQLMSHQWFIFWESCANSVKLSESSGSDVSSFNSIESMSFSPTSPSPSPNSISWRKVSKSNLSKVNHIGYFGYNHLNNLYGYSNSLPNNIPEQSIGSPPSSMPINIMRNSSYINRPMSRSNSQNQSLPDDIIDELNMSSVIC